MICSPSVLAPVVLVALLFVNGPPETSPEDDAQALFQAGQTRYETHDYRGAIEAFTAAYARAGDIADETMREEALARMAFNLARVHVAAFDIDQDVEHLRTARRLLADYRGHERALGRDPDSDTDVTRLEADLSEREHVEAEPINEPPPATRPNRKSRNAGISLLVLSGPLAAVAVTGAILGAQAKHEFESVTTGDARTSAQSRGRTGDILFGVGVGLTALSAVTGATLLGVSYTSKRTRVQARVQAGGLVLQGAF